LLHGLVTDTRQPPREGAAVEAPGPVGTVSSGNFSPMLGVGIALAFLDTASGLAAGDAVTISVRGKALPATVTKTPFWPPAQEG
jgi:aminomethyltransferase